MRRGGSHAAVLLAVASVTPLGAMAQQALLQPADPQRVVPSEELVRAGIELWRFVGSHFDPHSHGQSPGPAVFAPDAQSFVIVATRGRLDEGTIESRLLLFRAAGERYETVASLSSRGNDPPMGDVRWPTPSLILLRGAAGDERPQLYSLQLPHGQLVRETNEPAGIEWYDVSGDGTTLFYMTRSLVDRELRERRRLEGVIAQPEEPGWSFDNDDPLSATRRLVVLRRGSVPRTVWTSDSKPAAPSYFDLPRYAAVSPRGRLALLGDTLVPRDQQATDVRHTSGGRVLLFDLDRGSAMDVAEAPPQRASRLALWSPDESFVVFNANVPTAADPHAPALVELNVESRAIRVVARGTWRPLRWTGSRTLLAVQDKELATFERRTKEWRRLRSPRSEPVVVDVAQSPTEAPEVFVGSRRVTKLNVASAKPLAPMQDLSWRTEHGVAWRARLVSEAPTERRPTVVLVMDQSWNDGYVLDDAFMRAAFPAQALAARGFAVCMVYFPPELGRALVREEEWEIVASGFAGLLPTLAAHPAVDSARLGITGFSHAGWIAQVVIRKFPQAFAAALAIDNTHFSYFDYLINNEHNLWRTYDQLYSGGPFEASRWFERAVGFHPELVTTPVLLESHGGESGDTAGTRLAAWEAFAGLRRAGKPVELVRYTYGAHTLVRPTEQFSSAVRQIDWFAYWLMNEFDARPIKAEQYARWNELRRR